MSFMYADDLTQWDLNWGIIVILAKSKIVVFRNGGSLKHFEKWYFKASKIEIVSDYKHMCDNFFVAVEMEPSFTSSEFSSRKKHCVNYTIHVDFSQLSSLLNFLIPQLSQCWHIYGPGVWGYCRHEVIGDAHVNKIGPTVNLSWW